MPRTAAVGRSEPDARFWRQSGSTENWHSAIRPLCGVPSPTMDIHGPVKATPHDNALFTQFVKRPFTFAGPNNRDGRESENALPALRGRLRRLRSCRAHLA